MPIDGRSVRAMSMAAAFGLIGAPAGLRLGRAYRSVPG
jgi:hypothetical protein